MTCNITFFLHFHYPHPWKPVKPDLIRISMDYYKLLQLFLTSDEIRLNIFAVFTAGAVLSFEVDFIGFVAEILKDARCPLTLD